MVVLKRKNGQVDLSGGKITFVSGSYEAKRRNEMYLGLHRGEIEDDPERGINYFDFLFNKQVTLSQAEAYLKSKILSIPGNLELTDFSMSEEGERHLKVRYTVKTAAGETPEVTKILEDNRP